MPMLCPLVGNVEHVAVPGIAAVDAELELPAALDSRVALLVTRTGEHLRAFDVGLYRRPPGIARVGVRSAPVTGSGALRHPIGGVRGLRVNTAEGESLIVVLHVHQLARHDLLHVGDTGGLTRLFAGLREDGE